MMPLQWPEFYLQPVQMSWLKRLWHKSDYLQVMEYLQRQLLTRSRPDLRIWGEDPMRIRMGIVVCKKIQETYEWPNDHFLPEDPFDILMLMPWDDLEIAELVMGLEEDLEIDIPNPEVEAWFGATLSTVVDRLMALEQRRTPQPSGRRKK